VDFDPNGQMERPLDKASTKSRQSVAEAKRPFPAGSFRRVPMTSVETPKADQVHVHRQGSVIVGNKVGDVNDFQDTWYFPRNHSRTKTSSRG
jgi:hypothetical protein